MSGYTTELELILSPVVVSVKPLNGKGMPYWHTAVSTLGAQ